MKNDPKVAAIIVNWNKKNDALRLLGSLKAIDYDNYDILVIDNASTDDSVKAIKEQFPEIDLTVNPENLGGTGGFNSGMRRALEKAGYEFLWLLDNDAVVEQNTLRELVNTMESDDRIGLAGSRIVDPERRDITVEAGAFIKKDSIGVSPLYRNVKNLTVLDTTADVDYVAICSALVRASALESVGLMDERYFIFWDDMDWGISFKRKGFRVVSVLDSIAYHPAFTEKRGPLVDCYYGNRNSLLTYAKYTGSWKTAQVFHTSLRQLCTNIVLLGLNGKTATLMLSVSGVYDFAAGNWGKIPRTVKFDDTEHHNPGLQPDARNILILNDGSRDQIQGAFECLKTYYPGARFTLLITSDRKDFFKTSFENIITIDIKKPYSVFYLLSLFIGVLRKEFDISVSFTNSSPFLYATGKSYVFDSVTGEFYKTGNNLWNIWKPVLSTLSGEIMSIILLPILWASSLKYKKS